MNYYNENNPHAAQWLRELIKQGVIGYGWVDERSIEDVKPSDLEGFTQHHFFAGIGVWSYALRQAGWPDSKPIWTASCPCQPFSQAGQGLGFDDKRHLWPHLFWLVVQCRPKRMVGEQVSGKDGRAWIDLVQADLEGANFASGSIELCSAGVGSPNIRHRNYWFALGLGDTNSQGLEGHGDGYQTETGRETTFRPITAPSQSNGMADATGPRLFSGAQSGIYSGKESTGSRNGQPERSGTIIRMADDGSGRRKMENINSGSIGQTGQEWQANQSGMHGASDRTSPVNGSWRNADWLFCKDGKWRPVEPGTFPLAHGVTGRMDLLRGYGNAINAEVAKEFIQAISELMT